MNSIPEMKATLPQTGKIESIGLRPGRKVPLNILKFAEVDIEEGLIGDRYSKKGGNRQITLIQKEHIDTVGKFLNKSISHEDVRRNIIVSGINLLALHDSHFLLGDEVLLKGTGNCHPCSRMETNLGAGGYNAMRGHGGITATVIKGGTIAVGDAVKIHNEKISEKI